MERTREASEAARPRDFYDTDIGCGTCENGLNLQIVVEKPA